MQPIICWPLLMETTMNTQTASTEKPLARRLVVAGSVLALVCAFAAVFSGIGYQLELWQFRTGFQIIRWSFIAAIAAVLLSVFGLAISRKTQSLVVMSVIGIIVGGITVYIPLSWKKTLDAHPYIHDITTDLENPPQFLVVESIRGPDDHPVLYDGPEVAAQQREAYPDLQPLIVEASAATVFEVATRVVDNMGLELVDASQTDLRVEATDSTLLYGFKDDIVVRIVALDGTTKIDVRSKSRVGRSDLGQNAKRIREFLALLKAELAA
jgi:uncharacterized protein (DUF1499 family)